MSQTDNSISTVESKLEENSNENEWLDSRNTIRLPLEFTSKKGQLILFEYLKEENLPVIYEIIQRIGKDSEGINPNDFEPEEKLRMIVLPSIMKKLAIQMTDVNEGRILGMYYIQPSPLCRSASPVMHCGYGIIDNGYQDSGIGAISGILYALIAHKAGFMGLVARAGARNPKSYIAPLKQGALLRAYLPDSCETPVYGWTDDFIIYTKYIFDKNHPLLQLTDEQATTRALSPTKPTNAKPVSFSKFNKCFCLHDGIMARMYSTTTQHDTEKAFYILAQAASNGESFGIDEFPNLDIFSNNFLKGRQLIIINIMKNETVGIAVLGASHLCRSSQSPNAVIYFCLLPKVRGRGYGKQLYSQLEEHTVKCGFTAILTDILFTREFPNTFMRDMGYSIVGSVPNSAYVKGQGWTDAIIFYNRKMDSHL